MKYSSGRVPAPWYCGLLRRKNVIMPAKKSENAKL